MNQNELHTDIGASLFRSGFKVKIVSVSHLHELQEDLTRYQHTGIMDEDFYEKELASFDWEIPGSISDVKSIILTATAKKRSEVLFELFGKQFYLTVPPTYSNKTDSRIEAILSSLFKSDGYFVRKANLPLKLLSVRSGLARYGKNNITFVEGMGSYYRLAAFYTDFPWLEDNWKEIEPLDDCLKCKACLNACPTGAISQDRFLLHAEKCLSFLNEFPGEFPDWVNPKWHNCIVGCMLCQQVCPVNKNVSRMSERNISFSEEETILLLNSIDSKDVLPRTVLEKLDELGLAEYLELLPRNLGVLIK